MRTTITLDDELVAKMMAYTGIKEKSALVHEALRQMAARRAAERLMKLGGTDPKAKAPPRRRPPRYTND